MNLIRTSEQHDQQCIEVEEDPEVSIDYGVNFGSILNQSRFYHVVGGLPGDAMHDILEGCLQYECKELLKYLITERKYFNLSFLNSSIANFDFGYQNDTDKPSPISELTMRSDSNTLHQRGTVCVLYLHNLPTYVIIERFSKKLWILAHLT